MLCMVTTNKYVIGLTRKDLDPVTPETFQIQGIKGAK